MHVKKLGCFYWFLHYDQRLHYRVFSISYYQLLSDSKRGSWSFYLRPSALLLTRESSANVDLWTWWRHQMETFSALLAICAENSPVPGEFTAQRPVTRSFDVIFDLRLNKRLSKQWWGWWFETLSHPLWRHRNEDVINIIPMCVTSDVLWFRHWEASSDGNLLHQNIFLLF